MARHPKEEPPDEFTKKLQEQFRDDFDTFSSRLERLESAWHKSGRPVEQAAEGGEKGGPGTPQVVDLDRGRARLQEILREKGWEKCPKCGESLT